MRITSFANHRLKGDLRSIYRAFKACTMAQLFHLNSNSRLPVNDFKLAKERFRSSSRDQSELSCMSNNNNNMIFRVSGSDRAIFIGFEGSCDIADIMVVFTLLSELSFFLNNEELYYFELISLCEERKNLRLESWIQINEGSIQR